MINLLPLAIKMSHLIGLGHSNNKNMLLGYFALRINLNEMEQHRMIARPIKIPRYIVPIREVLPSPRLPCFAWNLCVEQSDEVFQVYRIRSQTKDFVGSSHRILKVRILISATNRATNGEGAGTYLIGLRKHNDVF